MIFGIIFFYNFDPYNVLLALATNIPQRLKTVFLVQGHILYLPSESNHVMSANGKVSHLLIIMLITEPLAPTAGALFTPIPYFYIFFHYLKTVALIILTKLKIIISKYMH